MPCDAATPGGWGRSGRIATLSVPPPEGFGRWTGAGHRAEPHVALRHPRCGGPDAAGRGAGGSVIRKCTYRSEGLRLDSEVALVVLLGLMHFGITLAIFVLSSTAHSGMALVGVELGAAINVASTIVPSRIVMSRALQCVLMVSKTCAPRLCFSSSWRQLRMRVSSGIRSLIRSMPAKWRMVDTSIKASSVGGSLTEYHCCNRWICNNRFA